MTLDAIFEFLTTTRTRGALFTKSSRVTAIFSSLTLAFATDTFTVARTNFIGTRLDAGFVAAAARTIGSAPTRCTNTSTTFTATMIGAGANQAVVTFTGEIIAFTESAGDDFFWIGTTVAFTDTAYAIASTTAVD